MANKRFRHLHLQGSPAEIGWRHGSALGDEIGGVLDFYRGIFDISEHDLLEMGGQYGGIIANFNKDYAIEIEAIAKAAKQDARLIFALNSRSEIFNRTSVAECTAVFNSHDAVLAQNWDWSQTLQPLVADIQLERPDGHRIRMLTEPGIIGKIGMNNAGLGACLNILQLNEELHGLPVHVLLRAILDCSGIEEVAILLRQQCTGKASHVLIGDEKGACIGIEFAGAKCHYLHPDSGLLLHTNHYLADDALNDVELYPSTHERLSQARAMLIDDPTRNGILGMLVDQSQAELSICKPYTPSLTRGFGNVGTVFTVLMNLVDGSMMIRKGSSPGGDFYRVEV